MPFTYGYGFVVSRPMKTKQPDLFPVGSDQNVVYTGVTHGSRGKGKGGKRHHGGTHGNIADMTFNFKTKVIFILIIVIQVVFKYTRSISVRDSHFVARSLGHTIL